MTEMGPFPADQVWPARLPAASAIASVLVRGRDWDLACALTQIKFGCDAGTAGRAAIESARERYGYCIDVGTMIGGA